MEPQKMGNKRLIKKPVSKIRKKISNGSQVSSSGSSKKAKATDSSNGPSSSFNRVALSITLDEIALCAYFISERRRNAGLPGDEHQDWLQAEEQLLGKKQSAKKFKKKI